MDLNLKRNGLIRDKTPTGQTAPPFVVAGEDNTGYRVREDKPKG